MKNNSLKRKRLKKKLKLIFIFILLFIIIAFFYFLIQFEKKVIPVAIEISEKYAVTEINSSINKSCEAVISEMGITQEDFFITSNSSNDKYISLNTLLINDVCSKLSVKISEKLNEDKKEKIKLPLGILTGIDFLSNSGPECKITLKPLGSSVIDYETNFEAVGINQVNFQIYLLVKSEITIVNPFYSKNVIINRKLMLVNTIYNGEVPSTYMTLPELKK